jgi:SAM-dependent methyltransferase
VTVFSNDPAALLYNERYKKFGRDIRTIGWSNVRDQVLRFDVLFRGLDLRGKTILDVGCGLGDLVPYLERCTDGNFNYIGIDVAGELIKDARAVHTGSNCEFSTGDIFSIELPQVDISVLSGALSLKRDGIENYARHTLRRMIKLSRLAAALNFLTSYVDFEAPHNQHYEPENVFSWAKECSKRVNLIHDYPLYEFTIQVFSENN